MLHVNTRGRRRMAMSTAALALGTFTLLPAGVFAQVPAAVEKAAGSATKAAGSATKAAAAAPQALEAAAKASPDLVTALSKELGSSPAQAAGAAGALFGVAKSRLNPTDWGKVASAVPGMNSLLGAAPSSAVGTSGALGSAAGLASAASAFSKLGLKPELVAKAIPVLTQFVGKSGGAAVAGLLAGVLK